MSDSYDDYEFMIARSHSFSYAWDEFRWMNKKSEWVYFIDMSDTYLKNLSAFCEGRELDVPGLHFEIKRRGLELSE